MFHLRRPGRRLDGYGLVYLRKGSGVELTVAALRPAKGPEMIAFAATVAAALRAGDDQKLLEIYGPRIEAKAALHGAPPGMVRESFLGALREFRGSAVASAADLEARPWCGGRIFQIVRTGGGAFFRARAADGEMSMPLFVGMAKDGPRVVG
jgi:hypothetical protein